MSDVENDTAEEKELREIWGVWSEIQDYAKLRSSLALGSKSSVRDSAEGALNREITKKVNELSKKVLDYLKD